MTKNKAALMRQHLETEIARLSATIGLPGRHVPTFDNRDGACPEPQAEPFSAVLITDAPEEWVGGPIGAAPPSSTSTQGTAHWLCRGAREPPWRPGFDPVAQCRRPSGAAAGPTGPGTRDGARAHPLDGARIG